MPRKRDASGLKTYPKTPAASTEQTSASPVGIPTADRLPEVSLSALSHVYVVAPTPRKNGCANDSWPAVPIRMLRPSAPTAAPAMTKAVCNQNWSRYTGARKSTTASAMLAPIVKVRRVRSTGGLTAVAVSDTGHLLHPEQSGRSNEQHGDHHDERHHVAEAVTQELDVLFVAGGERLHHSDG